MRCGFVSTLLMTVAMGSASALAGPAAAQEVTVRLYPGTAPGSEGWKLPEEASGRGVRNVRDPELIAHLPAPGKSNGAAALILPGGALRGLSMGEETSALIKLLNANGIAAIVLKYRTLQLAAPAGPPPASFQGVFPKQVIRNANANPAQSDGRLDEVLRFATADALAALRIVRGQAGKWRIDPARVGMIGSSAGGGVAMGAILSSASATAGKAAFFVSLYGPSLQDVKVPVDAPPLFIATETDHGPVTDGLIALYGLWREAKRPAELHIYEVPTFRMPVALYGERMIAWLREQKIVPGEVPSR